MFNLMQRLTPLPTSSFTTRLSGWELESTLVNPDAEVKLVLHGGQFQEGPSPGRLAGAVGYYARG